MDRADAVVRATERCIAAAIAATAVACGGDDSMSDLPYAIEVVTFTPGAGAGFGEDGFPEVVLGPPMGLGETVGSLDVLSLGVGGAIVLAFAEPIVDGAGADFVVFENPFLVSGTAEVFAELGQVSVSDDGVTWTSFPCSTDAPRGTWETCAGWRPTLRYDPEIVRPVDPDVTGGDPFDLADIAVEQARFVRIDDLATEGEAPTAGFDLDAVGYVRR